jgi:hypothetical protein
MDIVKDGFGRRQSPSVIRERILAKDENMRRMAGFLRSNPIYSEMAIVNSVEGFLDAASQTHV